MNEKLPVTPPPDVSAIQEFEYRELNEVNDRLKRDGWVLLAVLVNREVDEAGNFNDIPSYLLGYPR